MAARADLLTAYAECQATGDDSVCEQIAESVAELDTELRALGVRGRLTPLDPPPKPVKRSTRRRQDAPDLPRRPVERRTVGRVFAGRYRPSTFLTLTLDSYGRVDGDGAAVDPDRYDYRRAARDAIHFPALLDRFWQNTRRCVGWDVQYFGTVEPQKRGAPHFHAAIRGAIPRAELRAITAATYHQVWWPAHDQLVYIDGRLPVWDSRVKAFTDPDTGQPLPTWEQACEELIEPAHVVRFGAQVHVKGILGGTEEAGRHVGYLTKYLTKSIGQAAGLDEHATDAHRDHAHRLHAELQHHPVLAPVPGVAALRHPTPRRPTLHDPRTLQRQSPQTRTPRHRRTPCPRLPQVVQQDPAGPPRRTRRIRSATPPPGRHPPRPWSRGRALRVGTPRTHRPRRPTPARPAAARHR